MQPAKKSSGTAQPGRTSSRRPPSSTATTSPRRADDDSTFTRRVVPAGSTAMQSVKVPPVSIHTCHAAVVSVSDIRGGYPTRPAPAAPETDGRRRAAWGAGRNMPIAAGGQQGTPMQEGVVLFLLLSLSVATVVLCGLVLWGLRHVPESSPAVATGVTRTTAR